MITVLVWHIYFFSQSLNVTNMKLPLLENMAGSDEAILLMMSRWSGSGGPRPRRPVVPRVIARLPSRRSQIGRTASTFLIVKGSFLKLGAPSLPNPSLSSTALVASDGPNLRLAVQYLKFKDNHKTVNVDPKSTIPETFHCYFEITNEDGQGLGGWSR